MLCISNHTAKMGKLYLKKSLSHWIFQHQLLSRVVIGGRGGGKGGVNLDKFSYSELESLRGASLLSLFLCCFNCLHLIKYNKCRNLVVFYWKSANLFGFATVFYSCTNRTNHTHVALAFISHTVFLIFVDFGLEVNVVGFGL